MSTPRHKKLARQEQHQVAKRKAQYEKLFKINNTKKEFKEYVPKELYVRETQYVPSLQTTGPASTPKPEPKKYTGTLVKGIATMHKSNAVPIINRDQATDIARMRRG